MAITGLLLPVPPWSAPFPGTRPGPCQTRTRSSSLTCELHSESWLLKRSWFSFGFQRVCVTWRVCEQQGTESQEGVSVKKALGTEGAPTTPAEALAGPEAVRGERPRGEGAEMRRLRLRLECTLGTASRAQRAERAAGVFRQRTHPALGFQKKQVQAE